MTSVPWKRMRSMLFCRLSSSSKRSLMRITMPRRRVFCASAVRISEIAVGSVGLKALDDLVSRRDANREAIIDRRVAEITGPGDAAKW